MRVALGAGILLAVTGSAAKPAEENGDARLPWWRNQPIYQVNFDVQSAGGSFREFEVRLPEARRGMQNGGGLRGMVVVAHCGPEQTVRL